MSSIVDELKRKIAKLEVKLEKQRKKHKFKEIEDTIREIEQLKLQLERIENFR